MGEECGALRPKTINQAIVNMNTFSSLPTFTSTKKWKGVGGGVVDCPNNRWLGYLFSTGGKQVMVERKGVVFANMEELVFSFGQVIG